MVNLLFYFALWVKSNGVCDDLNFLNHNFRSIEVTPVATFPKVKFSFHIFSGLVP